ncbi:hypothetical protein Scep_005714 [Stephania cephalantha]|uniref:Uncharacterized protein n=1 Tax=Stephania cephalantha TaxID=152367 RepID=A0AAP0KVT2_9MAGN
MHAAAAPLNLTRPHSPKSLTATTPHPPPPRPNLSLSDVLISSFFRLDPPTLLDFTRHRSLALPSSPCVMLARLPASPISMPHFSVP